MLLLNELSKIIVQKTVRMKILLCEDDEVMSFMVITKLRKEGMGEIDHAKDGKAAKEMVARKAYDVVILDIFMPFFSGMELIEHIRKDLELKTPIIILSAEGSEQTVLEAFELGADEFIAKPFSPAELIVRIKRLLR